jgi:uridine kinase
MSRYAKEPDFGPWALRPVASIMADVLARARSARGAARTGPLVVAVDGRSAGGKTTVADRLAVAVAGAVVVHTDDVAWHQGFFDWDELLVDGILGPVSRGEDVAFRPPAWVERGREGAIVVPAGAAVLVEGVGSAREALTPWLDAAVWVQSDADEAYRRGIERDVAAGRNRAEALAFWDEWMAQEVPFLAADRAWERADLVVCSTPSEPVDGLLVSRARASRGGPAPRTS